MACWRAVPSVLTRGYTFLPEELNEGVGQTKIAPILIFVLKLTKQRKHSRYRDTGKTVMARCSSLMIVFSSFFAVGEGW